MTDTFTVSTDQPDYLPGSTAAVIAATVDVGATINFLVMHIIDAGADGIYGTADDTLAGDLLGTGAIWSITDGGAGDLDGVANGVISTSWYVNSDALGQEFELTAQEVDADGNVIGTASTTFSHGVTTDFSQAANNNGLPH